MEQQIDNPILPGEKRMPGFSRYAMNGEGVIRNIMTGNIVRLDAEKKKYRLNDDEGQRKWFKLDQAYINDLFRAPEPDAPAEDNFTKEIIPTGGSFIASPHVDAEGNNIGEHSHNQAAKNSKKGMSDQDIRDLRKMIADSNLKSKFKDAAEKYGLSVEHARRIYKRQYFPNVI